MKNIATKISLLFLIALLISSCNATKRVPKGKHLLVKNEILVNGVANKSEEVDNLIYQKPNVVLIWKYKLRLNLYNFANPNPDSTYKAKFVNNPEKYAQKAKWLSKKQVDRLGKSFFYSGIHTFLKKVGEAPTIIDKRRAEKSLLRLQYHYNLKGFFDAKATYKIDTISKNQAKIRYELVTGRAYNLDSIKIKIQTPALDSIYRKNSANSFLKNEQYNYANIEKEKNRITELYRNNGVYYFQRNFIVPEIDTVKTNKKTVFNLLINDRATSNQDTSKIEHFKIYKISNVNIFTDATANKKNQKNGDSLVYKDFNLYSSTKLKYKPKSLTDAIFITKGSLYADNKTNLTKQYLSNLKIFNTPNIQYVEDKKDTLNNSFIANIYLSQKKKFGTKLNFDVSHSNIQNFGISANGTLTIRNIFRGAETFEIGGRANLGSSKDLANPDNQFFNISEFGLDSKLSFPRILFPFSTERIIPKTMIPSTVFSIGFAKQRNIGLDKINLTSSLTFNWTPRKNATARLDLFNIQFVKNVNTQNYFNVYRSSYTVLNNLSQQFLPNDNLFDDNNNLTIDAGTTQFTDNVLTNKPGFSVTQSEYKTIRSIEERRKRLSNNELVFASSFIFSKTTKGEITDENYYTLKTKLESAGNVLSLFSKKPLDRNGNELLNTFFGVNYSQYLKGEFEFIKHWKLSGNQVFAMRSFTGIAIPYGNSRSIPFSRSYFAGGSNDNRAWQAYTLGPGRSGAINDFNEANFKIAFNSELRFNVFSKLNAAIFADVGNIWNIFDNVDDEASKFSSLKSLKDLAVGSGFGIRYDFNFFIFRFDLGFKTYDPAITDNKKWFRDYNFANSVLNIGINYPF